MTSLLCTGGAGFVGTNLVRQLAAETDWSITVLDALTYAGHRRSLDGLDLTFVRGSITDADLVDELVAGHDLVINVAAETHNDVSLADPGRFVDTNLVGTFAVLEAVRRHDRRLHHVSTDEVYGDLDFEGDERFDVDSPFRPSSPYSATKAGSDLLVRAWVRSYGIAATISHCSNNYGPYQHVEKFIPRQISTLLDGGRPRIYGHGRHVRDWLHVADHAAALRLILERGEVGVSYLIGADNQLTNQAVVAELLTLFGWPADAFDRVPDRPGHDRRYALDSGPLRALGWAPGYPDFAAGLADTVAWYAEHEDWWRPDKAATEARYAETGR